VNTLGAVIALALTCALLSALCAIVFVLAPDAVPMSLRHKAFHLLRRFTSQHQRERLKARIFQARHAAEPLLKKWHGTFGNDELEAALREKMPDNFEILMVHSGVTHLQPMYQGDARSLLELMLRIAGPERTLAMPAFFFGTPELFNLAYYRKYPRFDVRRTPSQMGLVTELFRRTPGVTRSLHPTHSICALGPLANELCATHHLSPWRFGELSPFGIMARRKTTIIGLGVYYYRSLTQVHSMEDILGECFPVPRADEDPVQVEIIDKTGKAIRYEIARPLSRDFVLKTERLSEFVPAGEVVEWSFKGTNLYVAEAEKVNAAVKHAARRGHSLYEYSPALKFRPPWQTS
jgi:aminoglycoside 3-N-acetyltransferase